MKPYFIPSPKPKDTDPPEFILSFNVSIAPPTYVTCQVEGTSVDIFTISREVAASLYAVTNGAVTSAPMTIVNVTLRARLAGEYRCTVSVFRASGNNLTDATTPSINISGAITLAKFFKDSY